MLLNPQHIPSILILDLPPPRLDGLRGRQIVRGIGFATGPSPVQMPLDAIPSGLFRQRQPRFRTGGGLLPLHVLHELRGGIAGEFSEVSACFSVVLGCYGVERAWSSVCE